jgi:hypothetical protein
MPLCRRPPAFCDNIFNCGRRGIVGLCGTQVDIWTQLIRPARPIGRSDRFFEMGGHSLLGFQALRQMQHQLRVKLDFRSLYQESLADIATRCRALHAAQGDGERTAARPVAV